MSWNHPPGRRGSTRGRPRAAPRLGRGTLPPTGPPWRSPGASRCAPWPRRCAPCRTRPPSRCTPRAWDRSRRTRRVPRSRPKPEGADAPLDKVLRSSLRAQLAELRGVSAVSCRRRCSTFGSIGSATPMSCGRATGSSSNTKKRAAPAPGPVLGDAVSRAGVCSTRRSTTTRRRRRRVLELGLRARAADASRPAGRARTCSRPTGRADAVAFAAHSLALNEVTGEAAVVDWAEHGEALAARRLVGPRAGRRRALPARERGDGAAAVRPPARARAGSSCSPIPAAPARATSSPPRARASRSRARGAARSRSTACGGGLTATTSASSPAGSRRACTSARTAACRRRSGRTSSSGPGACRGRRRGWRRRARGSGRTRC